MVLPHNSGLRPRKTSIETIRKQNYWITQNIQEPTPWYAWDSTIPNSRGNNAEQISKNKDKNDTKSIIKEDLRNYLLSSTLHGLRYIGEKKLTWFERFFWLAAFISSVICAAFFILNVYAKWRRSPMIVSINPESMPLGNLPFPALTICNVNQAKKSVAERYMETGDPVDKKLLQSLCTTRDDAEIFEDNIAGSANWDHTRSFLINVTQPCAEMLTKCIWDSETMNCQDLFNAQLTDEGLCCTFNVVHRNNMFRNPRDLNDLNLTFPLPAVDWTPEDGYPPDAPDNGFPWRPKGIGTQHGLTLVLDANIAEYYCASTKSAGFKILLHNPTETPKIRDLGEIYGPGVEVRVAIRPRILDSQATLRKIDISKRLCLFSSEKELVFFRYIGTVSFICVPSSHSRSAFAFLEPPTDLSRLFRSIFSKTYTLKNCEMECEARAMLDICKCVYYYMPKNKSTRICGKADAKCYTNMSKIMPEGRDVVCQECLPACTEIAYQERASSAPLKEALVEHLALELDNRSLEYFTENMLLMHFYFEENNFMRFTKGEIFGLTEFLSNTGGLLGLCMGFSVMSAVELLYYLTLRAFCNARKRRPRQPFIK